ncbi:ribosome maturation factor RimM [Leptospirillum ferrooxidans]|uniref:Putative 16S rRNA processing protein n=1 Tax=Leptospirillum ferrooxidans (strain C2-3) TaxID=1162668 RepID=I0IPL0_LEPFC|nr:ribosome maturation factor RimM [Leptospirillum ferrooxidans]BAM07209.1 putative 16S rRNA processing protein [Leptospirillum ferrooxidans C2-3]
MGAERFFFAHLLSDNPNRFLKDLGATFVLKSPLGAIEPRKLLECKKTEGKDSLLLSLEGIDSPESAKERSGWAICLGNALPWVPTDENVYLISDLEGMSVIDIDSGQSVGVVSGFYERPGQDILSVDSNGVEVLVPFVEPLVPLVDRNAREVHVRWKVLDPSA